VSYEAEQAAHAVIPSGEAAVPRPAVVAHETQAPAFKKYPTAHEAMVTAPEAYVHVKAFVPHVKHVFDVVFKTYVAEQTKQYDELYPHQHPPVKAVHVEP